MRQNYPLMDEQSFLAHWLEVGVALDIDETLAWTVRDWAERLLRIFGNDEGLSPEGFVRKYPYSWFFPEKYRSAAAKELTAWWIVDNEFQKNITPVSWAREAITATRLRVAAYITARPEIVYEGTAHWLEKFELPEAPVIMRPKDVRHEDSTLWKSKVLRRLHPRVLGIIDDSHSLAGHLDEGYQWTVHLLNPISREYSNPRIMQYRDWEHWVEEFVPTGT